MSIVVLERFDELPYDEALAELSKAMGDFARSYLDSMAYLAEHPEQPVDTVQTITGRPATPFATWASKNASQFS